MKVEVTAATDNAAQRHKANAAVALHGLAYCCMGWPSIDTLNCLVAHPRGRAVKLRIPGPDLVLFGGDGEVQSDTLGNRDPAGGVGGDLIMVNAGRGVEIAAGAGVAGELAAAAS